MPGNNIDDAGKNAIREAIRSRGLSTEVIFWGGGDFQEAWMLGIQSVIVIQVPP